MDVHVICILNLFWHQMEECACDLYSKSFYKTIANNYYILKAALWSSSVTTQAKFHK